MFWRSILICVRIGSSIGVVQRITISINSNLLVSSTDDLCKQFANSLDPDHAQQNVEPDSGFKVFDTDGFQQTTKNSEKLPSRQRVKQNDRVFIFQWKLSKN